MHTQLDYASEIIKCIITF